MEEEHPEDLYLVRAAAAYKGLYGCDLEEAYYPSTMVALVDGWLEPLIGTNSYVLRFLPSQFPLVDAFWSITIYSEHQFMVTNSINRYSIGDRTTGLQPGLDGSLDIYIQNSEPPADEISNWLPASEGGFSLTLRMYMPQAAGLDPLLYAPPPVLKQQ
jgi:hypothetical protein